MPSRVAAAGVTLIGAAVGLGALASAASGDLAASLPTTPPVSVSLAGGGSDQDAGSGDATSGGGWCAPIIYSEIVFRDSETWAAADSYGPGTDASVITEQCDGECPAGLTPDLITGDRCVGWVPFGATVVPVVTVDDLWPGAYDDAVSQIPLPIPVVAPPVVQGSLVNAPLWLAVSPPAPVSARAQVGAVWAQVDALFVGLTWDMGVPGTDDDIVDCDGPGEEWSEPGPNEDPWVVPECGWNYEQPSTPEHTGTGSSWYDISVTAHWEFRLTGSDGRDVALDPIGVPFEFDYVVYEWQTVGTG